MSAMACLLEGALTFLMAASLLSPRTHAAVPPPRHRHVLPPQQQPAAPAQPHKIKIWTNDDLVALRTPADIYILEKEAQAAEALKAILSCFASSQGDTEIEDTRKAIDETAQSIRNAVAAVIQARKDLDDAPENLKSRNRTELERRTLELDAYRDQLKFLQQRLQQLSGHPSAENPVVPAGEPPQ